MGWTESSPSVCWPERRSLRTTRFTMRVRRAVLGVGPGESTLSWRGVGANPTNSRERGKKVVCRPPLWVTPVPIPGLKLQNQANGL